MSTTMGIPSLVLDKPQPQGIVSLGEPGQPSTLLRSRIRVCPTQPRQYFDEQALRDLAGSIAEEGQRVPIEVTPVTDDPAYDFEITDGERRWRACGIANVLTMKAWINPVKDSLDQLIRSVGANFGREPHGPLEIANALQRMKDEMGDKPKVIERIAAICSKTPAWVYQHLSLLRLDPQVQALLAPNAPKERRMSMAVALPLTSLRPEVQTKLAEEIVTNQMSAKMARLHIRKAVEDGDGEGEKGTGRLPHKDYRLLVNFLERSQAELAYFRRLEGDFERMFAQRINAEKTTIVELVELLMKGHRELRDRVVKTMQG